MIRGALLAALLVGIPVAGLAQSTDGVGPAPVRVPSLVVGVLSDEISVDGHLDEAAWAAAPVATGFIQQLPVEGDPAVHDIEVRVLIGSDAIYIGARMMDSEPQFIGDQMSRRDTGGQFDYFTVALDPNLDRRTGYWFGINPVNVQADGYLSDDDNLDLAWNAVWETQVSRDEGGWTAEMRIPFKTLGVAAPGSGTAWTMNIGREHYVPESKTKELELSLWSPNLEARAFGALHAFGDIVFE